ncbi:MAG: type I restriction endonuclease subunit R [Pseudomonadota bacterium]
MSFDGGHFPLYGDPDSLISAAHNAFRFKRIYTSEAFGLPFISSSSIIDIDAKTDKYLSRKLTKNLDDLIIKEGEVLISCSGTIGNVGFAGKHLAGKACSQHVIRATARSLELGGFAAAFLRSPFGRCQLTRSTYGSVVQHIEPEHLKSVIVPHLGLEVLSEIGKKFVTAMRLRDDANDLLEQSRQTLLSALKLPMKLREDRENRTQTIPLSNLRNRFEAGFHSSGIIDLEQRIAESDLEYLPVSAREFATDIRAVTKFRKRIYVKGEGIPLYSSKSIFQIDPVELKQLGKGVHAKDLEEIGLKPGMVLLTCSGTIGNVLSVCDYMNGWAVNQHAIRLYSEKPEMNSLMYAWFSSEPGRLLIERNSYGSVILEIDRWMVGGIPVPDPNRVPIKKVHALVSQANSQRTRAWGSEQDAIGQIEECLSKRP